MNGIYAVDARVVLMPYKLDMVILDAVTVDVMMDEINS
jgi:hypothetical protein